MVSAYDMGFDGQLGVWILTDVRAYCVCVFR